MDVTNIVLAVFTSLSAVCAIFSAVFAHRASKQAIRANDIGRLSILIALRKHYLELMEHQLKLAKVMSTGSKGAQCCEAEYAALDSKVREVREQIDCYHDSVVHGSLLK